MRILTFTSLFPNSQDPTHGIFIYQRASHLASRSGNEVRAVSPVPYFPRWLKIKRWPAASALPSEETMNSIRVWHPRYPLVPKLSMPVHALAMFLGSLRTVKKLHQTAQIDCIDAHFVYPDGMAAVLLGKVLDIPVIVSARGTDINVYPDFHLIRPMIRWTLRHAAGIIAVSESLREKMVALGIPKERIHLVPNGVDPAAFRQISQVEACRRLNLGDIGPLLVSVGSLIPSKGHQILIEAVKSLAERVPGLQLYILGEGSYRPELEKLVKSLGLEKQVFLPGKRPNVELPLWFSAAAMSCLASSREGWPNVVSESLACGTPVVATRAGGIPEIVHSPALGILVERSCDAFAAGLAEALAKDWDRERISRESRRRTWETVAEEVEATMLKATGSR